MKYLFLPLILLILAGCNNDLFIDRLTLTPTEAVLDSDNRDVTLAFSGEEVHIKIIFQHGSEYENFGFDFSSDGNDGNNEPVMTHTLETGTTSLVFTATNGRLSIQLNEHYSDTPAEIRIIVSDGYNREENALVSVLSTGSPSIVIDDITYTTNQWGEYPDEFTSIPIMSAGNSTGPEEDKEFNFPTPELIKIRYYFFPVVQNVDSKFANAVLNSGIEVPIPYYQPDPGMDDWWQFNGDMAPLTTSKKATAYTSHIPPMPDPVTLPAHRPFLLNLMCDMRCMNLDCVIKAHDTETGESIVLKAALTIWVPVKLTNDLHLK